MKYFKKSKLYLIVLMLFAITLCIGTGAALSPSLAYERDNSLSTSSIDTKSNKVDSVSIQIGKTVSFGTFNNQPLKWKMLEINNKNEALLFAVDVLPNTYLPFDETGNVWETSSIRSWLNGTQKGEFLSDNNFTVDDRNAISQTDISSGILGNTTKDYVFLISKDEYYQYDIGNVPYDINYFLGRTGESGTENIALFASYHQANGFFNPSEKGGIRPMMWVQLGSLSVESDPNSAKPSELIQTGKTIENDPNSAQPNANADTISVSIQSTDNLVSSTLGRRYGVYGPFDGNKIRSVTCQLNNEVEARPEIAISGQGKTVEGVEITNSIGFGKTYADTISVSTSQPFYIFIGSDNLKNLTGTISFSNRQN